VPEDGAARVRLLILAAFVLVLAGCALLPSPASPVGSIPPGFTFIRDAAGLLPAPERGRAERQLAEIAASNGLIGAVVTGRDTALVETAASDVIAEASDLGIPAVVAFCTPDLCDLSIPDVFSPELADAILQVVPAPEPAPGQGLPPAGEGLRAWVEYVGALATLDD
jgi:hypothetical protein